MILEQRNNLFDGRRLLDAEQWHIGRVYRAIRGGVLLGVVHEYKGNGDRTRVQQLARVEAIARAATLTLPRPEIG